LVFGFWILLRERILVRNFVFAYFQLQHPFVRPVSAPVRASSYTPIAISTRFPHSTQLTLSTLA
jgi:hypothetical protein